MWDKVFEYIVFWLHLIPFKCVKNVRKTRHSTFSTTCLYKTPLKCVKNDESCGIRCKNSSHVEHFVQNSRRAFATNSTTSVEQQQRQKVQWGTCCFYKLPHFEQSRPKQKSAMGISRLWTKSTKAKALQKSSGKSAVLEIARLELHHNKKQSNTVKKQVETK